MSRREIDMVFVAFVIALGLLSRGPEDESMAEREATRAEAGVLLPALDLHGFIGKVWSIGPLEFCLGEPKTNTRCYLKYRLREPKPPPLTPRRFAVFGRQVCIGAVEEPDICAVHLPMPTEESLQGSYDGA